MAVQCSILCVQTAQAAIENIYSQLPLEPSQMSTLPAWWYIVFYIYTAATVLVAARLRPFIAAEISQKSIDQSWANALEILRRYESCSTSAKRCVAVLEILFDRVPQDFERRRQDQEQRQRHVQGGLQPDEREAKQTEKPEMGPPQEMLNPPSIPEVQQSIFIPESAPDADTGYGTWDLTLTDDPMTFDDLGSITATDMSWLDSFPPSL